MSGARVVFVMNDTRNIVVNKRFSFFRRAFCVLFCAVVDVSTIFAKYLEFLFTTYTVLPYSNAALITVAKGIPPL